MTFILVNGLDMINEPEDKFHTKEFLWVLYNIGIFTNDEIWTILGWIYD